MSIMATDGEQTSFAFSHRRDVPFNDLPPLPPRRQLETNATLKKAISANKALAELRGAGELIPDQSLLVRALVLQEARLSSEVENIVTTNDELYRAFEGGDDGVTPETKEVLRYEQALWHGYQHLRHGGALTSGLFVQIVNIIKQIDLDVRDLPGTCVKNRVSEEVIYTPPVGKERLRGLLNNVAGYLNDEHEDGADPLIKMAAAHYQFEAIHPFSDGNGRTGRVLNILYLLDQKLLDLPTLYLSRYILSNKSGYYEGLRRVTEEEDWEGWVLYMLDAVEHTSRSTRSRILEIRGAMNAAFESAKEHMGRRYRKDLVELVFERPYTRISFVEKAGIAGRQAAAEYLRDLERIGILASVKVGRDVLFVNHPLMRLLSA